jgi:hypothetical protein
LLLLPAIAKTFRFHYGQPSLSSKTDFVNCEERWYLKEQNARLQSMLRNYRRRNSLFTNERDRGDAWPVWHALAAVVAQ